MSASCCRSALRCSCIPISQPPTVTASVVVAVSSAVTKTRRLATFARVGAASSSAISSRNFLVLRSTESAESPLFAVQAGLPNAMSRSCGWSFRHKERILRPLGRTGARVPSRPLLILDADEGLVEGPCWFSGSPEPDHTCRAGPCCSPSRNAASRRPYVVSVVVRQADTEDNAGVSELVCNGHRRGRATQSRTPER